MSEQVIAVVKLVGPKLGEKAVEHLLDEHLGLEDAKKWKKKLGLDSGADLRELKGKLDGIDVKINELKGITENTEVLTTFQAYNKAAGKLTTLMQEYTAIIEPGSTPDQRSRENAVAHVLDGNYGVYAQIGKMRAALLEPCITLSGSKQSILENFANNLVQRNSGVLKYCHTLEAVIDHYMSRACAGFLVREAAKNEAKDDKNIIKDVVTHALFKQDVEKFGKILGIQKEMHFRIMQLCDSSDTWFRLENAAVNRFLTIYDAGMATSPEAPFGDYTYDGVTSTKEKNFMPQVFAAEQASGQQKKFFSKNLAAGRIATIATSIPGAQGVGLVVDAMSFAYGLGKAAYNKVDQGEFTSHTPTIFNMQEPSQHWRFAIDKGDYVRLINKETGKTLSAHDGLLRLETVNQDNDEQLWEPILSNNRLTDKIEVVLRHVKSQKMMEADKECRIYAKSTINKSNQYHVWIVFPCNFQLRTTSFRQD